ncbi:MAG: serine hydrolase [Rhodoferax sp.]
MKHKKIWALLLLSLSAVHAQNMPKTTDGNLAPDEWLLASRGPSWWYTTKPSPTPVALRQRAANAAEQAVIDRARQLMADRPAKAFALMDGDTVVYSDTKAPANSSSLFHGFSMGKTVTAMAVGQAICAGRLQLTTKASDVIPELSGKALGNATVRDLLMMASGATDANSDSTVWTPEQNKAWNEGTLNLSATITTDERIAKAQRGVFSDYKPGEYFSYKSTDPLTLGLILSRATGTVWNQWIQERILNPMGAAYPGLLVQDRQQNGLSDGGTRLRLEDWQRFALWVKRSSKEQGCFGDYVRAAQSTQINNVARKSGREFGGYGYLTWTDNYLATNTAWAIGYGGQRISWHKNSDRMLIAFSNVESWMPDIYAVARDWNQIKSMDTGAITTLPLPRTVANDNVYKQQPRQSGSKMTEAEIEQAMRDMSEQK